MRLIVRRTPSMTVQAAREYIDAGAAVVLDVREPDEWKAAHVAGAVHMPLDSLPRRQGELPRGQRILAICRSGSRSATATAFLLNAGYQVENIDGGMKAWVASGFPIEPVDGRVI